MRKAPAAPSKADCSVIAGTFSAHLAVRARPVGSEANHLLVTWTADDRARPDPGDIDPLYHTAIHCQSVERIDRRLQRCVRPPRLANFGDAKGN